MNLSQKRIRKEVNKNDKTTVNGTKNTYEEVYECRCGCRFVALHPRHLDDEVRVHRVEHEEKKFCLSTQY